MSTLLKQRLLQADVANLSVEQIVSFLNSPDPSLPTITTLRPTRIGPGTVMSALGPVGGAALLDALTTLAPSSSPIRWALKIIDRGELDLSVASARAQIDDLAAVGVMTATQAASLKALAEVVRHKSWAEHNDVTVDIPAVVQALSSTAPSIWLPAGTPVAQSQYVVATGGMFHPNDLVECSTQVGGVAIASFTAAHIVAGVE